MSRLLLAHISDSHFDERGDVEDQIAVHRAFVAQARAAGVHAIVHAGDMFERESTPRERLMLADFLREAADVAPVYGVRGNHDRALDLDLFPELRGGRWPVTLADRPGLIDTDEGFAILAVPWFDKAPLAAGVDAAAGREASRIATQDQARALLLGLSAHAATARERGDVPVLVAHVMVGGSVVSTGQMLLGVTVEVSPADLLTSGAEYVALGHVHKAQEWTGGRVAYSGSPRRCNHGETEPKGWRLVRFEGGRFAGAEFVELPARRLLHVDLDWSGALAGQALAEVEGLERALVRDARVRIRYRIAARDLALVDQGALRSILLAAGAYDVQLEAQVVQETRARAPELAAPTAPALSLADKLRLYLEQRGAPMERWSELAAKLAEIGG